MTANRELVKQRNISPENVEFIDKIHELLEKLIDSYSLEVDYEEALNLVKSANKALSDLWGFTYDERKDQWTPRLKQKHLELCFVGRTFEETTTGIRYTIQPEDVYECALIRIGESAYVDVGRAGFYSRFGGNIKEIY